jgi:hypothetical protein
MKLDEKWLYQKLILSIVMKTRLIYISHESFIYVTLEVVRIKIKYFNDLKIIFDQRCKNSLHQQYI